MDTLAAFQSMSDLRKSQVHYNHYNIFHILERKRLLHAKAIEVASANGQTKSQVLPDVQNTEVDKSTTAYKIYHGLELPPLPPRYQELALPPHWFIDIVHNQKKRRAHRKSHGLIPFKELAQLVASNHKSCDYETRSWCQDVATKILEYNKSLQEAFNTLHKKKKDEKTKEAREVTQEIARPYIAAQAAASNFPLLPGAARRHSDQDVEHQQMMQAYKMALERDYVDLANKMLEKERNPFNPERQLHGFDYMYNGPHPMSAPLPNRSFARSYDVPSPRFSMTSNRQGMRMNPVARLPFAGRGATKKSVETRVDVPIEDSKKSATKSDADMSERMPSNLFVEILYDMVNDPKTNDIIHWLDCGKIFNITDKKAFTKHLIPMFRDDIAGKSNNEKFKSFKACLKKLGFERFPSDTYNGAYKKDGFFKMPTMAASGAVVFPPCDGASLQAMQAAGLTSRDSAASLRQLEMLASANAERRAQIMSMYREQCSMYPRRGSLPGMMQEHAGMGQQRRMSNDLMLGYYQGLTAGRSSLPHEMANGRTFCLPTISDTPNSHKIDVGYPSHHVSDTHENLEDRKGKAVKK